MTPIIHWALARKEDYVHIPKDVTNPDLFAKHVFLEKKVNFHLLDQVMDDVHACLWRLVSTGDGPHHGDELVLQITNELPKNAAAYPKEIQDEEVLTLYYTLVFEEIHSFNLRIIRDETTDQHSVGKQKT